MYHRVLPDGADSFSTDGIVVTPPTFERHLGFLRRHFTLLDADSFMSCAARGGFPRRACLVTFDDGWFDNQHYALPLLQRFGVPAVLFVATGYVGTQATFWQEDLTRLLFAASRSVPPVSAVLDAFGLGSLRSVADGEARRLAREYVTELKAATPAEVDRVREKIVLVMERHGMPVTQPGDDRFLDWDSVRGLAASGHFAIATHAHSHRPLTKLGRAGAVMDLKQSLCELEKHGLGRPLMCAYPNGDHDAEVMSAAREAGLQMAFTTVSGHVANGDDPLCLRRVNVHESACSSRAEFMCRILGIF
jgi:peptidoglycan/xylan/chitin deacetylase (PgdA/CDA1 family)